MSEWQASATSGLIWALRKSLIYMKGKGIILREPTVVAIDRDSRDILAFGDEAKRMIGRTPGNILAIRPLREGAISDYELVSFMLKGFVLKAVGKHMFARPRAILALPTAINEMEKRSLISTMFDAGMRRTQLLNRFSGGGAGRRSAHGRGLRHHDCGHQREA